MRNVSYVPRGIIATLLCDWSLLTLALFACCRYPQVLPSAECMCRDCVGAPRGVPGMGCEPVNVQLPVLRRPRETRHCVNGFYEYHLEYDNITVGCTCARIRGS